MVDNLCSLWLINVKLSNVNKPLRFWRHLAEPKENVQYLDADGSIVDSAQIANMYNDYFHSVFSAPEVPKTNLDTCSLSELCTLPDVVISEEGILSILLEMDTKKSIGPDCIPSEFLKRYAEWVAKYLSVIFKASLEQNTLPSDWLTAKVVPVHKSGAKCSVDNYRTISITCICCKILEHVVSKCLYKYLEDSNILVPSQWFSAEFINYYSASRNHPRFCTNSK